MKVKVIKKKDLESVDKSPLTSEKNKQREVQREMISTVSDWVTELQKLRSEESKQVFEQLFKPGLSTAQSSS